MKEKTPKAEKDSVLTKTPVQTVSIPDYTSEERVYISNLQRRMDDSKLVRDKPYEEFDNLTYLEYWWANERGANTYIEPKKNKVDPSFQSGTLRTKMMALLATLQGLNLSVDISAFNEDEIVVNSLGQAMEDIIDKTQEVENDEEWRMLRQYELLKQGTVFVEEIWDERWTTEKEVTKGFDGSKTATWTSKKVKSYGIPKRSIIPGPSVYLGDIREYMAEKQPFLFTVQIINWVDAEALYGSWEMWPFVSRTKRSFSGAFDQAMILNAWRLTAEADANQVEVIKYQDKPNNEYQIILNGIPMLPMGYPLSAITPAGEYTLVQQNLEPLRHNFTYGKSFIFKNKNLVSILDQMMKLAVLKTQKSLLPPYLNLSDRVISRDIFAPGQISRGIRPGDIMPISDKEVQGVTNSELAMITEVISFIDRNTVSQTFGGQREAGGKVTATQILELQRQARIMIGVLILAASLLEKKLAVKRLMILLDKWFDPIDDVLDRARNVLRNRYRKVSRMRNIEGKGPGIRMVIPQEEEWSSQDVMDMEETMSKKLGMPVQAIILNPSELKKANLTWVASVNPKEKRSSELSKVLFGQMMTDAMGLGLRVNPDYIEERFAQVWEEDPTKMFIKNVVAPGMAMPGAPGAPGVPQIKSPIKKPSMAPETLV